jgi:hypothetical protein
LSELLLLLQGVHRGAQLGHLLPLQRLGVLFRPGEWAGSGW